MKFRYIERCSQGYVEFRRNDEAVRMHTGEVVDVPDWLGAKLSNNNHFEQVVDDGAALAAKRGGWPKGKPRKATTEPTVDPDQSTESEQPEPDADQ